MRHLISTTLLLMSITQLSHAFNEWNNLSANDTILTLITITPNNEPFTITAGTQMQYTVYGNRDDYEDDPCADPDAFKLSQSTNVPADQPYAIIKPEVNKVNSHAITERFGKKLLCFKTVEEITASDQGVVGTFVSGPFALESDENGQYTMVTPDEWTTSYTE